MKAHDAEDRVLLAAAVAPKDIPEALQRYLATAKLTPADLARGSGIPVPQVRRALAGEASDEVLSDLNDWIEFDARAQASRMPKHYVPTAVAVAMFDAARAAHRTGDVALCVGPSGIGKTFVGEAIAATIPGAIYVHVGVSDRSVTALARKLYQAAGRGEAHPSSGIQAALLSLLAGSGRLIICDQVHKLTDLALEWLYDLHDQTQCALLLIGTSAVRKRIDADLDGVSGQISSRTGIRVNLVAAAMRSHGGDAVFTSEEVRRIYAATGRVRLAPDATMALVQIANAIGRGSLRRCGRLVEWAARLARRRAGLGPDEVVVVHAADLRDAEAALDDSIGTQAAETPAAGRVAAAG